MRKQPKFVLRILRVEPLTHKLQYSKTPKHDFVSAIVGVIIATAFGYVALAILGSTSTNLVDLTCLIEYGIIIGGLINFLFFQCSYAFRLIIFPFILFFKTIFNLINYEIKKLLK